MVKNTMNLLCWLGEQMEKADEDFLRKAMSLIVHMIMDVETTAICGAEYNQRTDERTNSRNGSTDSVLSVAALER